jgi:hypothetical protein
MDNSLYATNNDSQAKMDHIALKFNDVMRLHQGAKHLEVATVQALKLAHGVGNKF